MPKIAPDGKSQRYQQNKRVKQSVYGQFNLLPYWVRVSAKVCLGLWILNFVVGISPIESRGTFGDTFGAANSIFSAFALLGVAWSISMQREELKLTREDRDETKLILSDQQRNSKAQISAAKTQRFEATFFQLLTAFTEIAQNINLTPLRDPSSTSAAEEAVRGRKAIHLFIQEVEEGFLLQSSIDSIEDFHSMYGTIYMLRMDELGQYFRTLFTILRFIDDSDLRSFEKGKSYLEEEKESSLDIDKYFYAKMLRAQISTVEATLLAINYISPATTDEFNALIDKYGMLKNCYRSIVLMVLFEENIPPAAFGRTFKEEFERSAARSTT